MYKNVKKSTFKEMFTILGFWAVPIKNTFKKFWNSF